MMIFGTHATRILLLLILATASPTLTHAALSGLLPSNITIAGMFPLSGALQAGGVEREAAFRMAINLINKDPSILPSVRPPLTPPPPPPPHPPHTPTHSPLPLQTKLIGVSYDTQTSAGGGISITLEASSLSRVIGIVGAASSTVSRAVQQVASVFQIPQISYSSTASLLSDKTLFPFFARVVSPDSVQGAAAASLIYDIGWRDVVTVRSDNDYGLSSVLAFRDKAFALGLAISAELSFAEGATTFDSLFSDVRRTGSRVIFLNCFPSDAIQIMEQAALEGMLNGDYVWVGTDGWLLDSVLNSGLPNSKLIGVFGLRAAVPLDADLPRFFQTWSTLNASLFAGAGDFDANFYAPYSFDATYALAITAHNIIQNLGIDPSLDGDLFMAEMGNISFPGVTGDVSFDQNYDRVASYELVNYQGGNEFTVVGRWTAEQVLVLESDIMFPGNVTTPPFLPSPPTAPAPESSNTLLVVLLVTSFAVIVICMAAVLAFIHFRRRALVEALEERNIQLDREARALNSRLDDVLAKSRPDGALGERISLPIHNIMKILVSTRANLAQEGQREELDKAIALIRTNAMFAPTVATLTPSTSDVLAASSSLVASSSGTNMADASLSRKRQKAHRNKVLNFVTNAISHDTRRGSRSHNNMYSSMGGGVLMQGAAPLPVRPELASSMMTLRKLSFDATTFEAVDPHPLTTVVMSICTQSAVLAHMGANPEDFSSVIKAIAERTPSKSAAPYRNLTRSLYLVQFVHYLLTTTQLYSLLSAGDALALILAAAARGVDHPGLGNDFLVETQHPVAVVHGYSSVLEKHQSAVLGQILASDVGIFRNLPAGSRLDMLSRISDLVLATDMKKHVEVTSMFSVTIEPTAVANRTAWAQAVETDASFRALVMKMVLKMADLSDAMRTPKLRDEFALRQMVEYRFHGDAQAVTPGMAPVPFTSGKVEDLPSAQAGIIEYVTLPMARSFSQVFPIPDVLAALESSLLHWQSPTAASSATHALTDLHAQYPNAFTLLPSLSANYELSVPSHSPSSPPSPQAMADAGVDADADADADAIPTAAEVDPRLRVIIEGFTGGSAME